MNPFQYLGNEHRELAQVLGVLDQMIGSVADGRAIDRHELDAVVDYFREVGDMAHHDKEETLLVPALVRHHMDWFQGPLAELRHDHRQERYLTRNLRHAARKTAEWSEEDKRHFVSVGRAYSDFLRAHMARENEVWFSVAAQLLPDSVQAELVEAFERFDREMLDLADYVAIRERALRLIDKYRT
ncbi:MAG TPA: hemerythrin domain-containing protein [Polyangiaceae bacterium]|nr:hemerythrin domain-containing protein [Polyangiaceae bacterium]